MSTEQKIRVVERVWQEIVGDGNLDLVAELVAEGYTYRAPGGLEIHGPQGFVEYVASLHNLFSNVNVTVHEYIADGNKIVSRWTGRGTHSETGREVAWRGATITRVVDGKMVDDWEYWDRLELAEQITAGWLQRLLVTTVANRVAKGLPNARYSTE